MYNWQELIEGFDIENKVKICFNTKDNNTRIIEVFA